MICCNKWWQWCAKQKIDNACWKQTPTHMFEQQSWTHIWRTIQKRNKVTKNNSNVRFVSTIRFTQFNSNCWKHVLKTHNSKHIAWTQPLKIQKTSLEHVSWKHDLKHLLGTWLKQHLKTTMETIKTAHENTFAWFVVEELCWTHLFKNTLLKNIAWQTMKHMFWTSQTMMNPIFEKHVWTHNFWNTCFEKHVWTQLVQKNSKFRTVCLNFVSIIRFRICFKNMFRMLCSSSHFQTTHIGVVSNKCLQELCSGFVSEIVFRIQQTQIKHLFQGLFQN